MSSFKRKTGVNVEMLSGTKVSPAISSVLLTSSGISSFDDILGGGVQLGTTCTILNDDYNSSHSELVQKYFIAQGLSSSHTILAIADDSLGVASSCMWTDQKSETQSQVFDEEETNADSKVRIAWRYENMQRFQTTVSSSSNNKPEYCRPFDLSQQIPPSVVQEAIESGSIKVHNADEFNDGHNSFENCLRWLHDTLQSAETNSPVRISLAGIGSASWGDRSCERLLDFLFKLRLLLRKNPRACALVTLPAEFSMLQSNPPGWIEKIGWASDACILLSPFTSDPSMHAQFSSHHGLCKIITLPRVHTLVPASDRFSSLRGLGASAYASVSGGVGENNLAFRVTRKRLLFETLNLDVEGGTGERRTTPAPSSFTVGESVIGKKAPHAENTNKAGLPLIEVQVEKAVVSQQIGYSDPPLETPPTKTNKKKVKRVGFQVDRPDLYGF